MANRGSTGKRIGKGVLWATGLASLPGIAKSAASPIKDVASETTDALKRHTPRIAEAKAAWNLAPQDTPEARFSSYLYRYRISEEKVQAMLRQYNLLLLFGIIFAMAGVVVTFFNLSGVLLVAMAGLFSAACGYRRDALRYRRLPTFAGWMKERLWWIFG